MTDTMTPEDNAHYIRLSIRGDYAEAAVGVEKERLLAIRRRIQEMLK